MSDKTVIIADIIGCFFILFMIGWLIGCLCYINKHF